jgi:hypothetical protein
MSRKLGSVSCRFLGVRSRNNNFGSKIHQEQFIRGDRCQFIEHSDSCFVANNGASLDWVSVHFLEQVVFGIPVLAISNSRQDDALQELLQLLTEHKRSAHMLRTMEEERANAHRGDRIRDLLDKIDRATRGLKAMASR